MIRRLSAVRFVEPAERGGNLPMLVRCQAGGEVEATSVYVKTRAGYGDRPAAPGVELFTTLLARELGLSAPEPVLMDVPVNFHEQVFEHPQHRELLARSAGVNFGTVSLGLDWKTWPVGMSVRAFPATMIEAILVFDALVQHTDRAPDNPNLLWRGHELAVLDHEKCFGYLGLAGEESRPWRAFFRHDPLATHCLLGAGRDIAQGGTFGQEVWERLVELELAGRISGLAQATAEAFPASEVELQRICVYLEKVFRGMDDFFGHLRHVLTR